MNKYAISTQNPADKAMYGIRITQRDGTTSWIGGFDEDGLFFPEKGQAVKKLKEMQADDRFGWNCKAEVADFKGMGEGI